MGKKRNAFIFWSVLIAFLSLMPSSSVPSVSWGSAVQLDKLAHIVLYAIYTILLGRYLKGFELSGKRYYFILLFFPIFYGTLMEVLQYYLSPSRFFDILDIIANIIGSIAGLLTLKIKF